MIAKISHGQDVKGLVRYLMGPGKANEHTDQHVVAASNSSWTGTGPERTAELGRWLDAWNKAAQDQQSRPAGKVWHCSFSLPPGEELTEAQWQQAAERLMERVGLHGPDAAGGGVRWAAIAHGEGTGGNQHIHIAAVLVDAEGTPRIPWDDFKKAREVCRELEAEWDLTPTSPANGTANTAPTTAEKIKAERLGEPITDREWLAVEVAALAGETVSLEDLIAKADARGIVAAAAHVSDRGTPYGITFGRAIRDGQGAPVRDAEGKLVLPKDGNGEDITYGGGRLAKDLTLPKLQARWEEVAGAGEPVADPLEQARTVLDEAADRIGADDLLSGSVARSAADTVAKIAVTYEADPNGPLHQAARDAAHASRELHTSIPRPTPIGAAVQMSSVVLMTARAGGADKDVIRALQLIRATQQVMDSLARLRKVQGHRRQAAAARRSGRHLLAASTNMTPTVRPTSPAPAAAQGPQQGPVQGPQQGATRKGPQL